MLRYINSNIKRDFGILFVGIVIGGLVSYLLVVLFPKSILEGARQISNQASFISAISSVILAVVTAVYVILTLNLVQETRESRKQEMRPILSLQLEGAVAGGYSPKVKNIGNGPAQNVTGEIVLEPDGDTAEIGSENIQSGGFTGSIEPVINSDTAQEYSKLSVSGTYEDVFGNENPFSNEIDLSLLEKMDGSDAIMDQNKYAEGIRQINKRLDDIADNLDMDWFKYLIKSDYYGNIIDVLEDGDGEMTINEIAERTGLQPHEIAHSLTYLHHAGAVEYEPDENEILDSDMLDTVISIPE